MITIQGPKFVACHLSLMKKIKLGILDQSIIQVGKTAKQAVDETIATVRFLLLLPVLRQRC